jgi:protein TorT
MSTAGDKPWWPIPVYAEKDGKMVETEYVPLQEKPSKRWHLVSLIPHIKDVGWVSSNYGLISEAKRQGVKVTCLEAGGYENLSKQLAQYDDALAMGADALLLGVISETALLKKIEEGKKRGVVQVAFQNPIFEAPFDGNVAPDIDWMVKPGVEVLAEHFKDKQKVRTVVFPGPPGSGWAELFDESFKKFAEKLAPGKFEVLESKFGETGKSAQLKMLEDSFQTHGKIDLLFGCAPMVEVSYGVLEERGLIGKTIAYCEYQNEIVYQLIKRGEVWGMSIEEQVMQGRIAVDMAIKALEKKPMLAKVRMKSGAITVNNINQFEYSRFFAPKDYKMVFKLD